jgi:hypothetical protein
VLYESRDTPALTRGRQPAMPGPMPGKAQIEAALIVLRCTSVSIWCGILTDEQTLDVLVEVN